MWSCMYIYYHTHAVICTVYSIRDVCNNMYAYVCACNSHSDSSSVSLVHNCIFYVADWSCGCSIHVSYFFWSCWLSDLKTWVWKSGITYSSKMLLYRPTHVCLSPYWTDWKQNLSIGTRLTCVLRAKTLCLTTLHIIFTIMPPSGLMTGYIIFLNDKHSVVWELIVFVTSCNVFHFLFICFSDRLSSFCITSISCKLVLWKS